MYIRTITWSVYIICITLPYILHIYAVYGVLCKCRFNCCMYILLFYELAMCILVTLKGSGPFHHNQCVPFHILACCVVYSVSPQAYASVQSQEDQYILRPCTRTPVWFVCTYICMYVEPATSNTCQYIIMLTIHVNTANTF